MTRLVVAEKRSVGMELAKFLGAHDRGEGYMEGNGYVVTWCAGHLVELRMPSEYPDKGWDSWDRSVLPMIPARDGWLWKRGKTKGRSGRLVDNPQLKVVCNLMRRDDVDLVVNACDPDREGEGIFRRVSTWAHLDKPTRRLWCSSLTDKALRKGFAEMRPATDYAGLGAAAELRAKEDWLVGMNGSKLHHSSVGRVRTPTLRFVVDRDREIEGFVSKPYWEVVCDLGDELLVKSRKFEDEALARELADRCVGAVAQEIQVSRKRVKVGAPTLYNTTGAQKDASKTLGMTPSAVDDALQRLYEQKLGSYPRTSSKYITAADATDVRALVALVSQLPDLAEVAAAIPSGGPDVQRLVNDAKVEGHTALLPTELLSAEKLAGLDAADRRVSLMVCVRLLQAVMPDGEKEVASVTCTIADEEFGARAERITVAGWTATKEAARRVLGAKGPRKGPDEDEPSVLPAWIDRQSSAGVKDVSLKNGKTKPPARFTDATLLEAMEHASRYVAGKELKAALSGSEVHAGGLGTDATRGDIIKALVTKGFLKREKGKLISTEDGRATVDSVCEDLKSPVLTAEMEQMLSRVEHGEAAADDVLGTVEGLVRRIVAEAPEQAPRGGAKRAAAKEVGTCPRCGGKVTHAGKTFRCENARREKGPNGTWRDVGSCDFIVFDSVASRKVSDGEMEKLLAGETLALKGFKSRAGRSFGAKVTLDAEKHRIDMSF